MDRRKFLKSIGALVVVPSVIKALPDPLPRERLPWELPEEDTHKSSDEWIASGNYSNEGVEIDITAFGDTENKVIVVRRDR